MSGSQFFSLNYNIVGYKTVLLLTLKLLFFFNCRERSTCFLLSSIKTKIFASLAWCQFMFHSVHWMSNFTQSISWFYILKMFYTTHVFVTYIETPCCIATNTSCESEWRSRNLFVYLLKHSCTSLNFSLETFFIFPSLNCCLFWG